jgi:DNA-binding GntR family transcriptional regulator
MSGALKPGDRLIELKIAGEMATSQAPVREALRDLEAMGVIETHRNKGARVRVITNEELRQIYDVRAQLEGYATYLVTASAVPVENKLRTSIIKMTKAAEKKDYRTFSDHNVEFHRVIVKGSQNTVLLDLWETLNVKMRTMVNVSRSRGNLLELAQSHVLLVDAVLTGNPELASKAARDHVLTNKPGRDDDKE